MKLTKDYDFELKFHLVNTNKVTNASSRKEMHTTKLMMLEHNQLKHSYIYTYISCGISQEI